MNGRGPIESVANKNNLEQLASHTLASGIPISIPSGIASRAVLYFVFCGSAMAFLLNKWSTEQDNVDAIGRSTTSALPCAERARAGDLLADLFFRRSSTG